jgi:hypothetical protein
MEVFDDETSLFRSWMVRDGEDPLSVVASRGPDHEIFYSEPWTKFLKEPVPTHVVIR